MVSGKRTRTARVLAVITALTIAGTALAGCAPADGRETVRFTFSKREAIDFMTKVVNDYNASQSKVRVEIDTSGVDVVSASFVRGNPPDLMLANYNFEVARFVQRCALTDLSDTEEAGRIRKDLQPLLDQYGICPGKTTVLPYSVMAASVIYNKEIFAKYGIEVPKTWDELIAASDTLKAAGVTPFYGTFKDNWTIGQGWYDYAVGGEVPVVDFFKKMNEEGTNVGPNSQTSFSKDFAKPVDQMTQLIKNYTQPNAGSQAYVDGNLAFAKGQGAMYLQGPWAFGEIAKTSPDLQLGTFPLPMTNDPKDLKVRVNMDLAAMIPTGSKHQKAARDFLAYLYQPSVIDAYNAAQLGFAPTTDATMPNDPRIAGMIPYYDQGAVYQGASVLVPKTIPVFNYVQAIALGGDVKDTLSTMDADWARAAFLAPKLPSDTKGTAK
ncbi:ABC transporter substrate-binding protein [Microbacterium sp. 22303]|uniref:ABC transporter substrate-binding protein n=1 Tax=Microbacterium sp. 22303 TaxID=3453905 RepID=UPI003F847FF8